MQMKMKCFSSSLDLQVTRSDINETADTLLRHEKLVFSLLMGDLINTVKQKGAGRLDDHRLNHKEVLNTPQFIFEETAHQTEVMRNVLVLEQQDATSQHNATTPIFTGCCLFCFLIAAKIVHARNR